VLLLDPNDVRPDSKIGQGLFPASKWLILAFGVGSLVLAVVIVVLVVRARLKAKKGDDLGPISSRGGRSGPPSSRPPPPRARP
jgi:hypothetical protein